MVTIASLGNESPFRLLLLNALSKLGGKTLADHIFSVPAIGLWIVIVVTIFATVAALVGILIRAQAVEVVRILVGAGAAGGGAGAAGGFVYGKPSEIR